MKVQFFNKFRSNYFKQKTLVDSFILIFYKLTLDFVYVKTVSRFYGYAGMKLNPSFSKYIISTIVFILMVKPIVRLYKQACLSSLILLLINLLYFIPGCTFYSLAGISNMYFLFFIAYWTILMILDRFITLPLIKKVDYASNKILFYSLLIILTAGILFISGTYNGFNLHFSLSDVYGLRFAQRKLNLPTIINYFQPIAATLVPITIVYCLVYKKLVWSLILIFIQLLSFAFGGMKMTLFFLIGALLSYFFYKESRKKLLVLGFIALNIISYLEVLIRHFSYVNAYITYRVLFIPNLISTQFFDFFNNHELLFFRDSIMNKFGFSSPYPYPVPNLIARIYYSDVNGNANNGLCGDAFSNFGWFGLLIFPFLIIVFCKFLDSCSRQIDSRILFTTAIVTAMLFTNGSFFMLMLSNGLLFASILVYILPRQKVGLTYIE